MILLDTHIWVWWISNDARLTGALRQKLEDAQSTGWALSVMSCWEVAVLVEKGRLALRIAVWPWVEKALSPAGLRLMELSPEIAVASRDLPGQFHSDPVDRIIIATARHHDIPLLTVAARILQYSHVKLV